MGVSTHTYSNPPLALNYTISSLRRIPDLHSILPKTSKGKKKDFSWYNINPPEEICAGPTILKKRQLSGKMQSKISSVGLYKFVYDDINQNMQRQKCASDPPPKPTKLCKARMGYFFVSISMVSYFYRNCWKTALKY